MDTVPQEQYWFWSLVISAFSLLISSIISIFVFLLSSRLNRSLEVMEISSKNQETISDLRAKLFSEVKQDINQIFASCYLVGNWRTISPDQLIQAKRRVDQAMIEALPIWGTAVMQSYHDFIDVCFQTKSGRNTFPLLRCDPKRYAQEHTALPYDWRPYFMDEESRCDWVSKKLPHEPRPSYRTHILLPAFVNLNTELAASMGVDVSGKRVTEIFQ